MKVDLATKTTAPTGFCTLKRVRLRQKRKSHPRKEGNCVRGTFAGFPIWRLCPERLWPVSWPYEVQICMEAAIPKVMPIAFGKRSRSCLAGRERAPSCASYHKLHPG